MYRSATKHIEKNEPASSRRVGAAGVACDENKVNFMTRASP